MVSGHIRDFILSLAIHYCYCPIFGLGKCVSSELIACCCLSIRSCPLLRRRKNPSLRSFPLSGPVGCSAVSGPHQPSHHSTSRLSSNPIAAKAQGESTRQIE